MVLIKEVNGVKVVDQEPAVGPHPRWANRIVPYTGISYVMLEDGNCGFVCNDCGDMRDKIKQAASHRSAHSPTKQDPLYPISTVKFVLRTVKRRRLAGDSKVYENTAIDMNHRGMKTRSGGKWTADSVGRLFRYWEDRIKVNVPPQRDKSVTPQPMVANTAVIDDIDEDVVGTVDDYVEHVMNNEDLSKVDLIGHLLTISQRIHDLSGELDKVITDVSLRFDQLENQKPEQIPVDPEILAKAARWDEFQKFMKNS